MTVYYCENANDYSIADLAKARRANSTVSHSSRTVKTVPAVAPAKPVVAAPAPVKPVTQVIHAWVDGASANNQDANKRSGGWGAVLELVGSDVRKEISGALPGATNNQAELEAVRQVLLAMKRDGLNIVIFTDSQYVIGALANGNKVKKNGELINEVKALMTKHTVTFEKVIGHGNNTNNNRADKLAKSACL